MTIAMLFLQTGFSLQEHLFSSLVFAYNFYLETESKVQAEIRLRRSEYILEVVLRLKDIEPTGIYPRELYLQF